MKGKKVILWLTISIAVVALASLYASSHPDGLERVAGLLGFEDVAVETFVTSPMPDYSFLPIKSQFLSAFFAGTIGVFLMFGLFWLAGKVFVKK